MYLFALKLRKIWLLIVRSWHNILEYMITQKRLAVVCGILLVLTTIYEGALYLTLDRDPNYVQIDRCIDSGGCWDGIDKVCRNSEPNAQELCDRSKVDGKTLKKRIEEKIDKINPEH